MKYSINIDTGGTFTDGFFTGGGQMRKVKVDTTPHDLTICFRECIEQGARRFGLTTSEMLKNVELLAFGKDFHLEPPLFQYRFQSLPDDRLIVEDHHGNIFFHPAPLAWSRGKDPARNERFPGRAPSPDRSPGFQAQVEGDATPISSRKNRST